MRSQAYTISRMFSTKHELAATVELISNVDNLWTIFSKTRLSPVLGRGARVPPGRNVDSRERPNEIEPNIFPNECFYVKFKCEVTLLRRHWWLATAMECKKFLVEIALDNTEPNTPRVIFLVYTSLQATRRPRKSRKYKWQVRYSMMYHERALDNYFIACHRK